MGLLVPDDSLLRKAQTIFLFDLHQESFYSKQVQPSEDWFTSGAASL